MKICTATTLALLTTLSSALSAQSSGLSISPLRPEPGAIVRLTLTMPSPSGDSIVSIRGTMAGEPLHFLPATVGSWHAIGGVPVDAENAVVASAEIRRVSGKVETVRARVTLPKIPPPVAQPLSIDSTFSRPLDAATAARVARENKRAQEIGRRAQRSPPMWTASFIRPRSTIITSQFGSGRVFNGQLTTRHLGVDFRGATGEQIRAANRGVVALVDNFFLAGNVVYVDHGGGVVTAYFHMSKPLVSVGDTVSRGQVIGLIGATGRVTGPHLHWAARYGAITVNPLDLVALGRNWYSASPSRKAAPSSASARKSTTPVRRPPASSRFRRSMTR
jgi:murein DD-endopeptidase MepM/ murein hydrolase activator NlpD